MGSRMEATLLSANPLVFFIDNFLDPEDCAHIIAAGRDGQSRGGVAVHGISTVSEARTNTETRLDQWADPRLASFVEKVSDVVRLPPEHSELLRVLRYREGEKFDAHRDGFGTIMPEDVMLLAEGGQRLFTALCYLNDVESGGETVFPNLKIAVRPRLGRLLVFANTGAGSDEVHDHSDHAGAELRGGEKWVAGTFWRQSAWHQPRNYPAETGEMVTY